MSTTIDERVVSMQFDNKQFESGAQTTMSTLDKLKEKLKFNNVVDGFTDISKAASSMDFSGVTNGIDQVTNKFSAFQSFVQGIFLSLGNDVYNFGKNMISSLTIDQVASGWSKYEEMTNSVATIMAATGQTQKEVYTDLEKFNWFADETSYSLTQMTGAYSKFAAAGVSSEDAMKAIMGLAGAAGKAGISAGDYRFQNVLREMSQAVASGRMMSRDWMSLDTANMSTLDLKKRFVEAGVAMGTLRKEGEKFYTVEQGIEVTAEGLYSTLNTGWVTRPVMLQAFGAYGDFVDTIYDYTQKKGVPAVTAMKDLYSEFGGTLGYESFKMIQATKTFKEATDATADAVSTKWMKIFEIILGKYEDAMEIWGGVVEEMYTIFAGPLDIVIDKLMVWEKYFGRTNLIRGLTAGYEAFKSVLVAIGEAASEVFKPLTGGTLAVMTRNWADFMEKLKPSEKTLENIKNVFKGLFSIIDVGLKILGGALKIIAKVLGLVSKIRFPILAIAGFIGKVIYTVIDAIKNFDAFGEIMKSIKSRFTEAGNAIKTFGANAYESIANSKLVTSIQDWVANLSEAIQQTGVYATVMGALSSASEKVKTSFSDFKTKVWTEFTTEGTLANKALTYLTTTFENLKARVVNFFTTLNFETIKGYLGAGIAKIKEFGSAIAEFFKNKQYTEIFEKIKTAFTNFGVTIQPVVDKIKEFFKTVKDGVVNAFMNFDLNGFLETLKTIGKVLAAPFYLAFKGISTLIQNIDLEALREKLKGVGDWFARNAPVVWDAIKKIGSAISSIKINDIFKLLSGIFLGGQGVGAAAAGIGFKNFASSLGGLITAIKDIIEGGGAGKVSESLNTLKDGLTDFSDGVKKSVNIAIVVSIAASLLMLAQAVKMIAALNPEMILVSLLSIAAGLTGLMAAMMYITMNFKNDDLANLLKATAAMMLMGIAIKFIASAIKTIAGLDPKGAAIGAATVSAILLELALITSKAKQNDYIKLGLAMFAIAGAVKKLAGAVKTFGEMDVPTLIKGIVSVGIILTMLNDFASSPMISDPSKMLAVGAALIGVAVAIDTLALAVKLLGNMPLGNLVKGTVAIGALIFMLYAFVEAVTGFGADAKQFLALGAGMALLSSALMSIALTVALLGQLGWETLAKGLIGIGAALIIMAAAIKIVGANFAGAAGLALLAASLSLLVPLFVTFALLSWEQIAKGLVGFGLALMILVAAGTAAVAIAPGLTALAIAAALIGVGMLAAGVGLVAFAAGLAALVTLGTGAAIVFAEGLKVILSAIITLLPTLATALALALAAFLTGLLESGAQIAEALYGLAEIIIDVLIKLIPKLTTLIVTLISNILAAIRELSPQIVETVVQVVRDILTGLSELIPDVVGLIMDTITEIQTTITEKIPEFAESGADMIIAFMDAFSTEIPRVVDAGYKSMIELINGLAEAIETNTEPLLEAVTRLCNAIIDAAKLFLETTGITDLWNAGIEVMQGFLDGIGEKLGPILDKVKEIIGKAKDKIVEKASEWLEKGKELIQKIITGFGQKLVALKDKAKELIDKAKEAISNKVSEWLTLGQELIQGFIDGVKAKAEEIVTAVTEVISGASDAVKKFLGIASPSRLFRGFGQYVDEGFIDGVNAYSGQVADSTSGMAQNAVDAFSEVMDDGFSLDGIQDPTIRPVMDLEGIQNGMSTMNGMFDSYAPGVTVRGNVDPTTSSSRRMYEDMIREFNRMADRDQNTQPITNNNTFNISSTDPKEAADEISRILQRQVDRRLSVWA